MENAGAFAGTTSTLMSAPTTGRRARSLIEDRGEMTVRPCAEGRAGPGGTPRRYALRFDSLRTV